MAGPSDSIEFNSLIEIIGPENSWGENVRFDGIFEVREGSEVEQAWISFNLAQHASLWILGLNIDFGAAGRTHWMSVPEPRLFLRSPSNKTTFSREILRDVVLHALRTCLAHMFFSFRVLLEFFEVFCRRTRPSSSVATESMFALVSQQGDSVSLGKSLDLWINVSFLNLHA